MRRCAGKSVSDCVLRDLRIEPPPGMVLGKSLFEAGFEPRARVPRQARKGENALFEKPHPRSPDCARNPAARGMRTLAAAAAALLCAATMGGCALGSSQVRDLSTEKAARLIVDGRTTAAELDQALGEPDYEIHMGHEIVRHYSWMRGRPSAKNFIPFNPVSEWPITQKNLRIFLDKQGVVKRHEFSGVFYVYRTPLVGTDAPHSFRPLTPAELDHFAED